MSRQLQRFMRDLPQGIDAGLILSDVNRQYFLDFHSSAGVLLVTRKKAYFIIDFRYYEIAKKTIQDCEVLLMDHFSRQFQKLLCEEGIHTMAVESEYITLGEFYQYQNAFPSVVFMHSLEYDQAIKTMRSIKTPEEIRRISEAQKITDAAFLDILGIIKAGMTEKQIAMELEYLMKRHGADGFAFDTIVVSGKNSSLPHGIPSEKPVEPGDFITMDFGARLNGYNSDMTRTISIGSVNEEQKRVYQTVLDAQLLALDRIKSGVACVEIDRSARDFIYQKGYEGCFGHGLGHSVGVEIHEAPAFNMRDNTMTQDGMVITVEPGIYLEGKFGVRIEDMVVIEGDSCVNLTASPKNLISL